ncbi:hypothetical protein OROGR_004292 [Orobanche gracilis]
MSSFKIFISFILVALSCPGSENNLASAGGINRRLLAPGDVPVFPTFPGAGTFPGLPAFSGPGNLPGLPSLPGPGNIPGLPTIPGPGNIPGLPTTIPDPSRFLPPFAFPGFTGPLPTLPNFPGTNAPGNRGGISNTPILPPPETTTTTTTKSP